MRNRNYKHNNKTFAYSITILITLVGISTLLFPFLLARTFPSSNLGALITTLPFFVINILGGIFLIYFIITGVYYQSIIIDNYIAEIKSQRTITGIFSKQKNILEMPKKTILKYAFYTRPFTFNTILMIKVRLSERKTLVKRFKLSFLSKKEKKKIEKILDKILEENPVNG